MFTRNLVTAVALVCLSPLALAEGDAKAGEETFEAKCANCHYTDDYADEADSVLEATLLAILSGEIRHRGGFRGLTEEDVANLAAYLEQQ